MINASLKSHAKELEKRLDGIRNQVLEKEKVCKQLLREITALKSELSSTNPDLKNSVFENSEIAGMLKSSKGRDL